MNKNLDNAIKALKAGINPQEDFEKNIKYINAACGKESLFPPLPENPTFEELEKITNNVLIACGKKPLLYDPSDSSNQEENIYTKYPEGPTDLERYLLQLLDIIQDKYKKDLQNQIKKTQTEEKKEKLNFKIAILGIIGTFLGAIGTFYGLMK